MIRNLGEVLTILARAEASEHFMHADVRAWGAPSECHADVSRGEPYRMREARKHAEAVARRPMRVIGKEARKRGMCIGSPKWQGFVSRIYQRHYPF